MDELDAQTLWWLNDESYQMLNRGYLLRGETVLNAIDRICAAAASYYVGTKYENDAFDKFKHNVVNGWQSFSSPIWANMGTGRGLPISCFNTHIPDTMAGIANKLSENIIMSKTGGGTSSYWGELRKRGTAITDNGKSAGPVPFMQMFDATINVVAQGGIRRGVHGVYLDIDHADIIEFLQIKDIGNPIQNLFTGVCVPDYWMQDMIDGDIAKRDIWAKVIESRAQKGLPYIFFTDTVNLNKPQIYKDRQLIINGSNVCSEIMLPSTEDESFVCCLASMNATLYDEWKDTDAVFWSVLFLDAVMSEFIIKTENIQHMLQSNAFAKRHRALGLGIMGFHSYLQKNMIDIESFEATQINATIFKQLQQQAYAASIEIGNELGFAPIFGENDTTDIPRRNTTLIAVAPNVSSASILGGGDTSPSIEPYSSNYYKAGLAKGNFMRTNKYLKQLLVSLAQDTEDVWRSIMLNHGSVLHLDFLSDHEKQVFKTFKEISQMSLIKLAAQRQQYIDQSQSLNLMIPSALPVKDVNKLMIEAWQSGVKTLYYQRSTSVSKELMTNMVNCNSCEA
jgi:ribonucleoside-diphosphate reductase alpha chain